MIEKTTTRTTQSESERESGRRSGREREIERTKHKQLVAFAKMPKQTYINLCCESDKHKKGSRVEADGTMKTCKYSHYIQLEIF